MSSVSRARGIGFSRAWGLKEALGIDDTMAGEIKFGLQSEKRMDVAGRLFVWVKQLEATCPSLAPYVWPQEWQC